MARPAAVDPYATHIAEAAQQFDIRERWIRAVLCAESAGDVRAVSRAGAIGLMQVMPDTWAALRIRIRLGRDPYDPRDKVISGAVYLRELWTAAAMSRRCSPPTMPVPADTTTIVRPAVHCPPRHAPMSPQSRRFSAVRQHPRWRARHLQPLPDWREAAIFVTRSSDIWPAVVSSSGAQFDDGRPVVPLRPPVDR